MLGQAIGEAVVVAAGFIEQMAQAVKTPVPDVDAALETIAQAWGLSQSTVELVKFTLAGEASQDSLYGLVNALTQSAQQLGIEERVELETLASTLVDTQSTASADRALRRRILSPNKFPAAE